MASNRNWFELEWDFVASFNLNQQSYCKSVCNHSWRDQIGINNRIANASVIVGGVTISNQQSYCKRVLIIDGVMPLESTIVLL